MTVIITARMWELASRQGTNKPAESCTTQSVHASERVRRIAVLSVQRVSARLHLWNREMCDSCKSGLWA